GASIMVRGEVLEAIGGFDENYFLYYEETDFCYRARKAGFTTWYVPQSRVVHLTGQSTQVGTDPVKPKRLPPAWFDSRRRYFTVTYGQAYAKAADLVVVLAYGVGCIKRVLQRRTDRATPHYIADLLRHSSLWSWSRTAAPVKTFKPSLSTRVRE